MALANLALLLTLAVASLISSWSRADAKLYDFKFCATPTEFEGILESHCDQVLDKRSQPQNYVVRSAAQAKKFLGRAVALRRSTRLESERTSPDEECCNEGCKLEEIFEYCHIWI